MKNERELKADSRTFSALIDAINSIASDKPSNQSRYGLHPSVLSSEILNACANTRDISLLRRLYNAWIGRSIYRQERDPIWKANRFIGAFARLGEVESAFSVFDEASRLIGNPDVFTFMSLLEVGACTTLLC